MKEKYNNVISIINIVGVYIWNYFLSDSGNFFLVVYFNCLEENIFGFF